jgi:uncharacterized protein YndB with AHSA1/START domain/predicted enzyme related to lactoylglutathione lyase
MIATKTGRTQSVEAKRIIKAPCERLFQAWTTPAEILKWFGCESSHPVAADVDLRAGGQYHIRSQSEKYGEVEVGGVYLEIRRPNRLMFTWKWATAPMSAMGESQVTVDFTPIKDGTEVKIRHEGFTDTELRDDHLKGWNGVLEKLEQFLAGSPTGACAKVGEISWNELVTQDLEGSVAFYTQLFGWTAEKFGSDQNYILFKKDGTYVGGAMKCEMANVPTHWLSYVTVENCDMATRSAQGLRAKLIAGPKEIPTVGRIAVLADAQGATFGLFQPQRS